MCVYNTKFMRQQYLSFIEKEYNCQTPYGKFHNCNFKCTYISFLPFFALPMIFALIGGEKSEMILKTNAVPNTDQVKQLCVRNVFGEYMVMSVIWNIWRDS